MALGRAYDVVDGGGGGGLSAYEVAVLNGFTGTTSEWLDSLVGADGERGLPGINGLNGTNGLDGYIPPSSPSFTYTAGKLTRVDYADEGGSPVFATLQYIGDKLSRIDLTRGGTVYRKVFAYTNDELNGITETTI